MSDSLKWNTPRGRSADICSQIVRHLKVRIESGELHGRLPGVHRLGEELGVDFRTVNSAFDRLVEEGYLYRRPKSGTYVRLNRRPRRSTVTAILHSGAEAPLHARLINGMQQEAIKLKQTLILEKHQGNGPRMLSIVKKIVESESSDGIILWYSSVDEHLSEVIEYTKDRGIPIVFVPYMVDDSAFDTMHVVGIDLSPKDVNVTQHLIDEGHEKIAFVGETTSEAQNYTHRRYAFYKETMEKADLEPEPLMYIKEFVEQPERRLPQSTINQIKGVTALVCATDRISYYIFRECSRAGLTVPGDLALAAYDNIDYSMLLDITSVDMSYDQAGREGMGMIVNIVDNDIKEPQKMQIPARLVVRGSSSK